MKNEKVILEELKDEAERINELTKVIWMAAQHAHDNSSDVDVSNVLFTLLDQTANHSRTLAALFREVVA